MTMEEFYALPKEMQVEIFSRFNKYIEYLENSIWDHDPCEYELCWYLMFRSDEEFDTPQNKQIKP